MLAVGARVENVQNISQGSAATCLSCGGIAIDDFITVFY